MGQQIVVLARMAFSRRRSMFGSHLDHRVQQSRIVTYMMSSDRDPGFDFTSCVADRFRPARSEFGLTRREHTKRRVRTIEIVPDREALQPFLNRSKIRWHERDSPPMFQAPEEPLDLGVELPHTDWPSSMGDPSWGHGDMKRSLELRATITDDESGIECVLIESSMSRMRSSVVGRFANA